MPNRFALANLEMVVFDGSELVNARIGGFERIPANIFLFTIAAILRVVKY